jgi:hypothetical protein
MNLFPISMKVFCWGLSIGRLHVTWLDLWTREVGLWIEWIGNSQWEDVDRNHLLI